MGDVEVQGSDAVTVDVGELVTIRLPENATTGFVWSVEVGPGLVVEADRMLPPRGAAPGAAGEHVVRVRAEQRGRWEVRLRQRREWEDAAAREECVTVTVR
jgi:predicted secreted protein